MANEDDLLSPSLSKTTPEGGVVQHLRDADITDLTGDMDADFAKFKGGATGDDTLNGGAGDDLNDEGDTDLDTAKPEADKTKAGEATPTATTAADKAKADADKVKADAEAEAKKKAETPEDEFDKVKLPNHARPATGKQFEEVKRIGRDMVKTATTARDAAVAEAAQLKERLKAFEETNGKIKPEDLEELQQLREWNRLNEYQSGPQFKAKFEAPLAKATEDAFQAMKDAGYGDDAVAKVKELGGLLKVDIDAIASKMGTLERESFLAPIRDMVKLGKERTAALEQAKVDKAAFEKRVADMPDPRKVSSDLAVKGAEQTLSENKFFDALDEAKLPEGVTAGLAKAFNAGGDAGRNWLGQVKEALAKGENILPDLIAVGTAAQRYLSINRHLHAEVKDFRGKLEAAEKAKTEAEAKLTKYKAAGASPRTPAAATPKNTSLEEDLGIGSMDEAFAKFKQGA